MEKVKYYFVAFLRTTPEGMSFLGHKNVFENTTDYVQFYVEIKNIKDVVKDL